MLAADLEYEISQSFTFDGAHHLTKQHREHYGDLHGHSFVCTVTITGIKSEEKQWVIDFEQFEDVLRKVGFLVDHKYHNEIEGLEMPSMENMSLWLAEAVWTLLVGKKLDSPKLAITKVEVQRTTLGEKATLNIKHLSLRPKKLATPLLDVDFKSMLKLHKKGDLFNRVQKAKRDIAELEGLLTKDTK